MWWCSLLTGLPRVFPESYQAMGLPEAGAILEQRGHPQLAACTCCAGKASTVVICPRFDANPTTLHWSSFAIDDNCWRRSFSWVAQKRDSDVLEALVSVAAVTASRRDGVGGMPLSRFLCRLAEELILDRTIKRQRAVVEWRDEPSH